MKTEVEVQNACDNPMDSQPILHKNRKVRCQEDVTLEQMCVPILPHHSVVVDLFDKGTMDGHL